MGARCWDERPHRKLRGSRRGTVRPPGCDAGNSSARVWGWPRRHTRPISRPAHEPSLGTNLPPTGRFPPTPNLHPGTSKDPLFTVVGNESIPSMKLLASTVSALCLLASVWPQASQAQTTPANAPMITVTRATSLTPQPGPTDRFTGTPDVTQLFGAQPPSHVPAVRSRSRPARARLGTAIRSAKCCSSRRAAAEFRVGAVPSRRCARATWSASRRA